jgi:hypothetical protein
MPLEGDRGPSVAKRPHERAVGGHGVELLVLRAEKDGPVVGDGGRGVDGTSVLKVHFSWPPESTAWRARSNAPKWMV